MQEIVKGYGKFIVTGLVTLTALLLVFTFSYYSSSGQETRGMMELVGNEATIREKDVNTNRGIIKMETMGTDTVAIICKNHLRIGQRVRISELFVTREVNGHGNKEYPCMITNITDEKGRAVTDYSPEILVEKDWVTVYLPGIYHFYVKTLPKQKTEVFTLCVMGEENI